jgi:DnaK suppressor protein
MRKRDLLSFEKQLLSLRAELVKSTKLESEDSPPKGDSADLATVERQRELSIRFHERSRNMGKLIDEALGRMADDEYGLCVDCGDDIPIERLKIRPFSLRCVPCQSMREKKGARGTPKEGGLLSEDIDVRDFDADKD